MRNIFTHLKRNLGLAILAVSLMTAGCASGNTPSKTPDTPEEKTDTAESVIQEPVPDSLTGFIDQYTILLNLAGGYDSNGFTTKNGTDFVDDLLFIKGIELSSREELSASDINSLQTEYGRPYRFRFKADETETILKQFNYSDDQIQHIRNTPYDSDQNYANSMSGYMYLDGWYYQYIQHGGYSSRYQFSAVEDFVHEADDTYTLNYVAVFDQIQIVQMTLIKYTVTLKKDDESWILLSAQQHDPVDLNVTTREDVDQILSGWSKLYTILRYEFSCGNYSQVIELMSRQNAADPSDWQSFLLLADSYYYLANEQQNKEYWKYALENYETVLKSSTDRHAANQICTCAMKYADILMLEGNDAEAKEYLTRVNTIVPSAEIKNRLKAIENNGSWESESGEVYDSYGNLIKRVHYDANGKLLWYQIFEYNSDNLCTSMTSYDSSDRKTDQYTDFTYDAYGNEIKGFVYNVETGMAESYSITSYNEANLAEESIYYSLKDNSYAGKAVYRYNPVITDISGYDIYDENDHRIMFAVYRFDKNGIMIGSDLYNDDGSYIGYEGENSEISAYSSSSDSSTGYSDEELISMAKNYSQKKYGFVPPIVEIDQVKGEDVVIHLYSIVNNDHTVTTDWLTINRKTGKGTNNMYQEVDLLNP